MAVLALSLGEEDVVEARAPTGAHPAVRVADLVADRVRPRRRFAGAGVEVGRDRLGVGVRLAGSAPGGAADRVVHVHERPPRFGGNIWRMTAQDLAGLSDEQ